MKITSQEKVENQIKELRKQMKELEDRLFDEYMKLERLEKQTNK